MQAYIHTKDRVSFIAILRQIHDGVDRAVLADEDSTGVVPDRTEMVGNIILDIANVGQNRAAQIEEILQVKFVAVKPHNT